MGFSEKFVSVEHSFAFPETQEEGAGRSSLMDFLIFVNKLLTIRSTKRTGIAEGNENHTSMIDHFDRDTFEARAASAHTCAPSDLPSAWDFIQLVGAL